MANGSFKSIGSIIADLIAKGLKETNEQLNRLGAIVSKFVDSVTNLLGSSEKVSHKLDELNSNMISSFKTTNDQLRQLQAELTLIKTFLGIEGEPVSEADLEQLTQQLKTSSADLDESTRANQP